jgi:hypothetical protein
MNPSRLARSGWITAVAALALLCGSLPAPPPATAEVLFNAEEPLAVGDETSVPAGSAACARTLGAEVVALDQVLYFNRLNVFLPSGMIYALKRDVEAASGGGGALTPGNVRVRRDKRPRPLVLRMNVGDCLEVTFTNLLAPQRVDGDQPATRTASMMVDGLSLVGTIASSGSNVGENPSSLAAPGETRVYKWYASKEGSFLVNSAGAMTGGEGDGGQPDHGLFGVVTVEPRGSVWYRSQLTAEELDFATASTDGNGFRRINYDALYPPTHRFAGKPVVKILDGTQIFHSDLNAVVANIPAGTYPPVTAAAPDNNGVPRDRNQAFREFTIVYHDENALVQAFPVLANEFFAHSVRDNMAINYGTGGVGAEIISYGADQIDTGPFGSPHIPAGNAQKCAECKYEEAFLSSWAVGDPAMIVERGPVQNDCAAVPEGGDPTGCTPGALGEPLQVLFPDDPSNVHHSYLNDHVKMRVLHGGVAEHHIHHLHAHQWLHQQNSDNSTYFDSQAIGPGSSFTLDIVYNGGGNRNKTPGDAIFHCHFYPHFAQGMWELWRVHDVFEDGTRKLPDFEFPGGTPVPALLPLPGQAMAPLPTAAMPGYPFYVPGVAGHRPPHPPLDTVDDGGLPRHVVRAGSVLDGQRGPFDRILVDADALEVPETGTALEQNAMAFHAQRSHATVTPAGGPATFITNGRPPVAGAPFADPCVDDDGNAAGTQRTVKAAVIQLDAIINKVGWHFPQTRMLSLWNDVADYQGGTRAPEPFFIRAHSNDCIEYRHTNLVPNVYDVDDFQVFTPTDIIGQHIHLVKFDVTSSDGSGNGFNYEDGTFSPDEVLERIEAINAFCDPGCSGPTCCGLDRGDGTRRLLQPRAHPFFGVMGAQTTIQRWWADPLLNAQGEDRTMRTVFTHDHFSPSTHQQVGLYAGLLIEPAGTTWRDPETGQMMGGRDDGGPTSWRADILTPNPADSYREFMLEFQDFHLAYTADNQPVNPPGRVEIGLPFLVEPPAVPMPEAISADDVGTFSINYRNEPIALRIRNPNGSDADGSNGVQAAGAAGDLAHAYRSDVVRADPALNVQPSFYPPLTADVQPGDPFTPLMRAYEGDKVQIRMLTGATEEGHNFTMHGMRWLHEPDVPGSGWINGQMNGISEHFELDLAKLPEFARGARRADYLYMPGASVDDQWNGMWGMLRSYEACVNADPDCPEGSLVRDDLRPLPSNIDGRRPSPRSEDYITSKRVCPVGVPVRNYTVRAVQANQVIPGGSLVYNQGHGLHDPTALMYVLAGDIDGSGRLRPGAPIEPLILRASAGDCIMVRLENRLGQTPPDLPGFNLFPPIIERFNANQVRPSNRVGLHPQLVHFEVRGDNGVNAGFNLDSTIGPGESRDYEWYAGIIEVREDRTSIVTPVEFGAVNLMPADLLKQSHKGLVAALVVEPRGSQWTFPEPGTRATADVTYPGGSFREFVTVWQSDVQLRHPDGSPVVPIGGEPEDSEDSANKGINYRTEPMWTRVGFEPGTEFGVEGGGLGENDFDLTDALSIAGTGPIETPIFRARVGTPVRFRALEPQGHGRNHVVNIHGHMWRHHPGDPDGEFIGSQAGHGAAVHWDIIPLHGAGGAMGVPGDYLYRNRASVGFDAGMWGVFRVTAVNPPPTTTTTVLLPATTTTTVVAPATTTTTLPPQQVVAQVIADVHTEATSPGTNFGNSLTISADADSVKNAFLRISVTGIGGRTVTSAQLTLTVDGASRAASNTGGRIRRIADCGWNEAAVTFNNQPSVTPVGPIGPAQGAVGPGDVVTFTLPGLTADGVHCYVVTSDSSDGVDYRSSESASNPPQVTVTVSGPAATTTTTVPTTTTTVPTTTTLATTTTTLATTTTTVATTTTTTTLPPAGPVTLFCDRFDNGLANWTESGEGDWNTEALHSSSGYPAGASGSPAAHSDDCDTSCTITLAGAIDLRGRTAATLDLLRFVDSELDAGEYLRLQGWNGSAWQTLADWSADNGSDTNRWHRHSIDLGAFLGRSDFRIRFVTRSTSTAEHVHADDVCITAGSGGPAPTTTTTVPTTTTTLATTTTTLATTTTTAAPPATTTTTLPPQQVTAQVVADAHTDAGSPGTNFGTRTTLEVDGSPIRTTFFRIAVSGVGARTVSSARLTLRVTNSSNSAGQMRRIASCTWTETGITMSNQPSIAPVGAPGPVLGTASSGQSVVFDLPGLTGDGTWCYAIASTSSDGVDYNSREASSNRPQVTVTVAP